MVECSQCKTRTSMPFTCKFCEQSFCSAHRLPENHDCNGLEQYKEQSHEQGRIGYTVNRNRDRSEVDVETRKPQRSSSLLDTLLPSDIPVTYMLLGVLFVVYALEVSIPGFVRAFELDAQAVLWDFEVWRIVTSMFLHANFAHLLVNSIVLFSFGVEAERMLGRERFLKLLIIAGIASSVGFTLTAPFLGVGEAVGFSGALYGMVAFLAVLRPDIRVLAFFIVPLSIRTAIIFFATLDVINVVTQAVPWLGTIPVLEIFASTGHLSGLLAGLFFAYRWRDRFSGASNRMRQVGAPFGHRVRRF